MSSVQKEKNPSYVELCGRQNTVCRQTRLLRKLKICVCGVAKLLRTNVFCSTTMDMVSHNPHQMGRYGYSTRSGKTQFPFDALSSVQQENGGWKSNRLMMMFFLCRVSQHTYHCRFMSWNHGLKTHPFMCLIVQPQACL